MKNGISKNKISSTLLYDEQLFADLFQGKMIMQDKLEKERNDAKNNVEEYVYDMRDKLHGLLEKYVSESVSQLPRLMAPVTTCRQI